MNDEQVFRTPPHSTEAEQSLLGALLLDNQAFERVADIVNAHAFYADRHRRIWSSGSTRTRTASRRGYQTSTR
jgi:replicative DNA helicase